MLLDSSELHQAFGTCQQLPSRHFPAFCACGRFGGGFCNARFNRHIQHMPAITTPAAGAASGGVVTNVGAAGSPSFAAGRHASEADVDESSVSRDMQERSQNKQQQQQQQDDALPESYMPTTYSRALAVPHSTWHHDGTDFTHGYLQQQLPMAWVNRPRSATTAAAAGSSMRRASSGISSRYMEPTRKHWEEMQQRPVKGPVTSEVARILDPARPRNNVNESWFTDKPIEELRIEREQQRAAQQQWLAVSHPREGAKYPNRSFAVHRSMIKLHHHYDKIDDDRSQNYDLATQECVQSSSDVIQSTSAPEADVMGHIEAFQAVISDSITVDSTLGQLHGLQATAAAAAESVRNKPTAWWEADKDLARLVQQMMQPSFAHALCSESLQADSNRAAAATWSSSSSRYSSARALYSTTLGVHDALIAENAVKAADMGLQMAIREGGSCTNRNSRMSAGDASRNEHQLYGADPATVLQTPEERHIAWVNELLARSVRQRQHQILLEAAAVCCK